MGLRVCGLWTYAVPSHEIQAIVAKGLTQKRTNNIKPDDREGRGESNDKSITPLPTVGDSSVCPPVQPRPIN